MSVIFLRNCKFNDISIMCSAYKVVQGYYHCLLGNKYAHLLLCGFDTALRVINSNNRKLQRVRCFLR